MDDDSGSGSDGAKWAIVDLFRDGARDGWTLRELTFATESTVSVNGAKWTVSRLIRINHGVVEAVLWVYLDRIGAIEEAVEGIAFLRAIEGRLLQHDYGALLSTTGLDRISLSAHFTKPLPDLVSVQREITFLDLFDLRGST